MINITSFYDQNPSHKSPSGLTNSTSSDKHFYDIQKRNNDNRIKKNANESVQKILIPLTK